MMEMGSKLVVHSVTKRPAASVLPTMKNDPAAKLVKPVMRRANRDLQILCAVDHGTRNRSQAQQIQREVGRVAVADRLAPV